MGNLTTFESNALAGIDKNGFVLLRKFFDKNYINTIRQQISRYVEFGHPGIIRDCDGLSLRGIHGPHMHDDFFKSLARNMRLVAIAARVLGQSCYLHQFKINMKQKLVGDTWPWHEDLVYSDNKTIVQPEKLVTLALLVDDSDLVSGPSRYLRNARKRGPNLEFKGRSGANGRRNEALTGGEIELSSVAMTDIAQSCGFDPVIGRAGDLLVFDSVVAPATAANFSSYNRRLLIFTFVAGVRGL